MHITRRRRVTLATILSLLAVLTTTVTLTGTARAGLLDGGCQRSALPVSLSSHASTRYTVVGWLCGADRSRGETVQVLVSGMTYDHHYWDLPYQPDEYSYVQAAIRDHHSVFNIDRIGIGQSDHPPADEVTVTAEAYVTHQIVQALRQGRVQHIRFARVIGVGHSLGSGILTVEDAGYHDLDALILTGLLHQGSIARIDRVMSTLQPAAGDPRFARMNMPAGYDTTRPGAATRFADFYDRSDADPAVAGLDNAFAQTVTSGEIADVGALSDVTASQQVHVPVLLVVGQNDSLVCDPGQGLSCRTPGDICTREAPDFPASGSVAAYVLPDAGHPVNLHYHANRWYAVAMRWVDHGFTASRPPSRRPLQAQLCAA
ncbi:alpha/beta fold hydrolase [Rugosimonospora africana]|uniref:Alpha/beta hydrolase n=1 Tax=Rugosimonospora africana TaxID=556532 RepID=A0A8J3QZV6_9ACTN|nr:alpha/beta fold hydrolase [Rugosimonospora africana]GIH18953.1 alpha/beta hydrolase [Rugosimonospora africana]